MIQVLSIRYMTILPILKMLPYKFKLGLHILTGFLILILTIVFIAIVGDGGGDIHTTSGNIV